uniref:Uncharacterized protein n=1 Tax=Romanomermis culicivorax TaxID=13658 RepID=A0A915J6T1_ROMCU
MPNFELLNYFVDPITDDGTKICSTIRLLDLFMSSPTFDKRKKKNNYPIIRSKDRHSGDKVDEFFELINNHNFRMDNFEKIHPIDQIARFCVCRRSWRLAKRGSLLPQSTNGCSMSHGLKDDKKPVSWKRSIQPAVA